MLMEINVGNALECLRSNAVNCFSVVGVISPFCVGSEWRMALKSSMGGWSVALQQSPHWAGVGYISSIRGENRSSGMTRNEQVSAKECEAGHQSPCPHTGRVRGVALKPLDSQVLPWAWYQLCLLASQLCKC